MNLYSMIEKMIVAQSLSKIEVEKRTNTFFLFNQLTEEEYENLMQLIIETYSR